MLCSVVNLVTVHTSINGLIFIPQDIKTSFYRSPSDVTMGQTNTTIRYESNRWFFNY